MRLWKRARLQDFFGREKPLIFENDLTRATDIAATQKRSLLIWAGKAPPTLIATRVEDGFLRSRGLGADLIPPLSLVTDDLGIYYDPHRESRLERLILAPLPPGGEARVNAVIQALIAGRVSKYNLHGAAPDLRTKGHRILVPGQVEDDASIRLGTSHTGTNLALLHATRRANPDAILIYKPHPDVANPPADIVATMADPIALIDACDEVWTMTSLLGFEALLRGKPVTCLGAPFYAGWGLTRDLGDIPARRRYAADGHPLPRPSLAQLAYATLIAYPRYYDPISRRPCPPEVALHRLATGTIPRPGISLRLLAKAQGAFATQARFWR
jgi:capsular polysaccharide export protein